MTFFESRDVVRHPLVKRVVQATKRMSDSKTPSDSCAVSVSRTETSDTAPDDHQLQQWAHHALDCMNSTGSIDIHVCGSEDIQHLNAQYRRQDKPTNVLSFPADIHPETGINHLGDIIACDEVILREAREQDKPLEHHWAHMITHSVLHLLGFDHMNDSDAAEMEAIEQQILAKLGISDPYRTTENGE